MTAPANRNAAPPGYYMLFLINDQGVPSVAKFVKLEEGGPLGGCGTPPPPDNANPTVSLVTPPGGTVAGTIEVRATASDDRGVVGRAVRARRRSCSAPRTRRRPTRSTWHTTGVADGTHTLTATARDASGKTAPGDGDDQRPEHRHAGTRGGHHRAGGGLHGHGRDRR